MSEILMNFASGVLSAAPGSGGTTLTSGNFAFLPVVAAPHTMRIALDPDGIAGVPEIVTVTAHTAAALTVTVLRGQETAYGAGAARAHAIDTVWRHVLTRASIVEMTVPAASVIATTAATPDPGYVFIDGSTITNGQVVYPAAWARIPAAWKSAPDIVLPDWRNRTLVMDDAGAVLALGALGGSAALTLAAANLPPHAHAIDHDHPPAAVTGNTGAGTPHTHPPGIGINYWYEDPAGPVDGLQYNVTATHTNLTSSTGSESAHTHPAGTLAVDLPPLAGASGNGPGTSTPLALPTPLCGVVNFALKVH